MTPDAAARARHAAWILLAIAYITLPIFLGTWSIDRVDCVYLWPATLKEGLSCGAYVAIGMWGIHKRDQTTFPDPVSAILFVSACFAAHASISVLTTCW